MTEEARKRLEYCRNTKTVEDCFGCPYDDSVCGSLFMFDAYGLIESLSAQLDQVTRERDAAVEREWDLFDLLSSAWHGKAYYFKQEDGSVYSRESCQYLTFDQAIDEFAHSLTVAEDINISRLMPLPEAPKEDE